MLTYKSRFVVPASTYGFCEKSGYIYAVSTSTLYKYENNRIYTFFFCS